MGLRDQVIKGGAYLSARLALGTVIGIGGVLLLTRAIGPASYGTYAAAFTIYYYLISLANWGIGVYLIRKEGEVNEAEYHQSFTLFMILGLFAVLLGISILPLLTRWIKLEAFKQVSSLIIPLIPISLFSLIATSKLERCLDYRRIAISELISQIAFYLLSVPLAYKGFGVWAPTIGLWAKEITALILLLKAAHYRPKFYWNFRLAKQISSCGISYSSSMWILQMRSLVNPLIVGHYLGAQAVGQVALTIRLAENLSFIKNSSWRLSIAALAKIQKNKEKLAKAINEGMQLQVLSLGTILGAYCILAPWIIPLLFGERWLPVLSLFPFVGIGYLASAAFNMHSSTLYVLKMNGKVALFNLLHVTLFAASACLFVRAYNIRGYGWAEVAALPSYIVLGIIILQRVGAVNYWKTALWFISFSILIFIWQLGWWAIVLLVIPGLLSGKSAWKDIKSLWKTLIS